MHFNHVGVMFPIEVVEMFQHLPLRNDGARSVRQVLEMRYSVGDSSMGWPSRKTVCWIVSISTSRTVRMGDDTPLARRIKALIRASSSPRSKGLLKVIVSSVIQKLHDRILAFQRR